MKKHLHQPSPFWTAQHCNFRSGRTTRRIGHGPTRHVPHAAPPAPTRHADHPCDEGRPGAHRGRHLLFKAAAHVTSKWEDNIFSLWKSRKTFMRKTQLKALRADSSEGTKTTGNSIKGPISKDLDDEDSTQHLQSRAKKRQRRAKPKRTLARQHRRRCV